MYVSQETNRGRRKSARVGAARPGLTRLLPVTTPAGERGADWDEWVLTQAAKAAFGPVAARIVLTETFCRRATSLNRRAGVGPPQIVVQARCTHDLVSDDVEF